jgi:SAM-dependent methyltransferase
MAITEIEYNLFRSMREQNVLAIDGDILELGESNWYGDIDLNVLRADISRFAGAAEHRLTGELNNALEANRPALVWEIANVFWQTFLQPRSMTAIDFHGTEKALRLDLNDPIDLQRQFDLILDLGTLEHVFNVAQAFRTIHDHTRPGGLMMHGLPFAGWVDHGFYNFNPTFYWDLAAANAYQISLIAYSEISPEYKLVQLHSRDQILEMAKDGQIGENALIYTLFRRPDEARPFRIPIQGYYAGTISRDAAEAWTTLR